MASILKVDELRGIASAGDITVTDNNNSNTYSLQNSISKGWFHFNGTGTVAIKSSFLCSSVSDNGTGNYHVTLTNAMTNTEQVIITGTGQNDAGNYPTDNDAFVNFHDSDEIQYTTRDSNAGTDEDSAVCCGAVLGDLA